MVFEEDLDVEHGRELVNQLVQKGFGVVAVFVESQEDTFHYIIGSETEDVRPLGKMLNQACNGRGGGKPLMVQGSVHATREKIRSLF